jgi:DNA invertase Pin-like site-specific DNA recombinase
MVYGYVRVSTKGQAKDGNSLEAQESMLRERGATEIYRETFTGTQKHRPQLDELLEKIGPGDTLMVTKLDRMARSVINGSEIVKGLIDKGVIVYVLNMGVMDNTPNSKLMRTIFFAFAEFEKDMIIERTSEGKEIAKQNPDYREGRPSNCYDRSLFLKLTKIVAEGKMSASEASRKLGVSRAKWYRLSQNVA